MKRLVALILLSFFLFGCAAPSSMPPYVVMLTDFLPSVEARCSGVLIDETHILTAEHCSGLVRVVSQAGQDALVEPVEQWPLVDLAIMKSSVPIHANQYAEFAEVESNIFANLWGNCPFYFPHTIRPAMYMGYFEDVKIDNGDVYDFSAWYMADADGSTTFSCGGDSGGVMVQSGKVVGMVSAVEHSVPFFPFGHFVLTIDGSVIQEYVEISQ